MKNKNEHIIISGGGTGGHIFPAIAIAESVKAIKPDAEILFVGAEGRMEMEKVAAAGFRIVGLPVAGIKRKFTIENFAFLYKLYMSLKKAEEIIDSFNPDIAIGVGGYASYPVLRVAARRGIPVIIQEQNSYAGLANRMLARRATAICVAYEGMQRYFPGKKIVYTGNPLRKAMIQSQISKEEALRFFGLSHCSKIIVLTGGSLGSRMLNDSVLAHIARFDQHDTGILWQTGKLYYKEMIAKTASVNTRNLKIVDFITSMEMAYAAADVIISRAGAISISELCLVGKPVILVPSPNVAEDHQTKNARALTDKDAAIMIPDHAAKKLLIPAAFDLLGNADKQEVLSTNIKRLATPDSAGRIANIILNTIHYEHT